GSRRRWSSAAAPAAGARAAPTKSAAIRKKGGRRWSRAAAMTSPWQRNAASRSPRLRAATISSSTSDCCWLTETVMKIVIVENPRPLTVEYYNDVANVSLSASLNSGYALAVARRAGWDTVHLDFSSEAADAATMAARILAKAGDIVLFHWVYSWGFEQEVCAVMALLRRESPAPIGAFGLFPTLSRSRLLQYAPQLDFILAGEFEGTLGELLPAFGETRAIAALPGVLLRHGGFVPRPLLADLDLLPIPDDVGANCGYPSLNIAASRGCFGACSFCFIHRYYGCSRRRARDPASLEMELATRLARREIESLYFIDPTFIGHEESEQERAVEISRIAKGLGLPFGFEARVDTIDEAVMATLAQ